MLSDNRDKPLQTSQDRSVDHDWSRGWLVRIRRLFRSTVLQIKPFGKLEIQLNRGTLEGPLQGVFDGNIYLGTVERSISWINLPFSRVVLFERFCELLFMPVFHRMKEAQFSD